MRLPLSLVTLMSLRTVSASFIPDFFENFQNVEKRCANPCGYQGWLCCGADQYCYTDANNQAACGTGSNGSPGQGSWQYVTTTYVQTDLKTVTATYSTFVPAVTQSPPTTGQCAYAQGESGCGSTCCKAGYYCQANNMCVQVPGGSSGYYSQFYTTVTTIITNTAGAPVRPTTQTILTLTSTGAAGTTTFQSPVSTGGALVGAQPSGGGLSGGAIAGIVIGVILGVILLLLICLCCCAKGLIDGLLSIFGLGPRRKRVTEETIIEERHRTSGGRTWFGTKPKRSSNVEVIEEKKKSGFGRGLGVATFLGTTAVLLGMKRRQDRKEEETNSTSYYGSDYYSYDYTSASSPSSVTRTSRRSRSRR